MTIKSNLNNAVSAKDPHGIASAVDLPPLPTRVLGTSGDGDGNSQQQHQEYLKIDSVDWSNVLNPLLDAHSAIQAVCDQLCFGANFIDKKLCVWLWLYMYMWSMVGLMYITLEIDELEIQCT